MTATYQDLVDLNLPEGKIGEIINGRLVVRRLPLPGGTHAHTALLVALRHATLNEPWWILPRVELCLGEDVLVPDLCGWRRERMPAIPKADWIELAPDWVCDVLVASSTGVVRNEKPAAYARHGIRDWWVVDTEVETVEVKVLDGGGYRSVATSGGNDLMRSRPFNTLGIDLHDLWPWHRAGEDAGGPADGTSALRETS